MSPYIPFKGSTLFFVVDSIIPLKAFKGCVLFNTPNVGTVCLSVYISFKNREGYGEGREPLPELQGAPTAPE